MKTNQKLLEVQTFGIWIFITFLLLLSYIPSIVKDQPKYTSDYLKIDINKADELTLEKVPYIGEETAKLIIEDRSIRGYYKSVQELKWIKNFEKVKDYLKVEEENE